MRLIDADALIDEYIKLKYSDQTMGIVCNRYASEIARVSRQPTIDAVPVVQCAECMYWQSGENECEKREYCTLHSIDIGSHSFCSYGERKDGERSKYEER